MNWIIFLIIWWIIGYIGCIYCYSKHFDLKISDLTIYLILAFAGLFVWVAYKIAYDD
jgi:predicted membrane channel-forming protein YqfA (hemolysin III family)